MLILLQALEILMLTLESGILLLKKCLLKNLMNACHLNLSVGILRKLTGLKLGLDRDVLREELIIISLSLKISETQFDETSNSFVRLYIYGGKDIREG